MAGTLLFHVRGDQSIGTSTYDAYYAAGSPQASTVTPGGSISHATNAGGYGSGNNVYSLSATWGWLSWQGWQNAAFASGAFSAVIRFVPRFTGNPAGDTCLLSVGTDTYFIGGLRLVWLSASAKFQIRLGDRLGIADTTATSASGYSATSGTAIEVGVTWDGTTSANALKLYVGRTNTDSFTATRSAPTSTYPTSITVGQSIGGGYPYGNIDINEVLLFSGVDTVVSDSRSTFYSSSQVDGSNNTSPGVANVRSGTTWYLAGVQQTGTATIPSLANTKTGVAGDGGTGTYDGSDRWTDPGQANVLTGIAYKANSTTNNKTGTYPANADITTMVTQVGELYKLAGLDSAHPMTVTPTRRTVDTISITLTGDGISSTTATRTS